jgi:hypothetical protein
MSCSSSGQPQMKIDPDRLTIIKDDDLAFHLGGRRIVTG